MAERLPVSGLVEPIRLAARVGLPAPEAFRLFTGRMSEWWPLDRYTFGPGRTLEIVIEPYVGGRFYERFRDGEEHTAGRVLAWEPPTLVTFTWQHDDWVEPTEVTVRFVAESPAVTRVEVEHAGWERLGEVGRRRRDEYAHGWPGVLAALEKVAPV